MEKIPTWGDIVSAIESDKATLVNITKEELLATKKTGCSIAGGITATVAMYTNDHSNKAVPHFLSSPITETYGSIDEHDLYESNVMGLVILFDKNSVPIVIVHENNINLSFLSERKKVFVQGMDKLTIYDITTGEVTIKNLTKK